MAKLNRQPFARETESMVAMSPRITHKNQNCQRMGSGQLSVGGAWRVNLSWHNFLSAIALLADGKIVFCDYLPLDVPSHRVRSSQHGLFDFFFTSRAFDHSNLPQPHFGCYWAAIVTSSFRTVHT
jgi:hypothetical protein